MSNIPNIKRYEITYTKAQLLYPTTVRKEERYKERGLAEGKKKRGKGCPGDEEDWSTYRLRKRYIKSSSCRQNDIQLHILLISLDGYPLKLCPLQTSPTLEYWTKQWLKKHRHQVLCCLSEDSGINSEGCLESKLLPYVRLRPLMKLSMYLIGQRIIIIRIVGLCLFQLRLFVLSQGMVCSKWEMACSFYPL